MIHKTKSRKRQGERDGNEEIKKRGVKEIINGVILFKEYLDVLVEYLCGVKTERGVWRGMDAD